MLESDDTAEDDTLTCSLQPSTSAEGPAPVYLIDPQALPADAEVRPTPVSMSNRQSCTLTRVTLLLSPREVVIIFNLFNASVHFKLWTLAALQCEQCRIRHVICKLCVIL